MKTPTSPASSAPLAEQRVLVVGASTSIGDAVLGGFLAAGAHVLATTNRQPLPPLPADSAPFIEHLVCAKLDLLAAPSQDEFVAGPLASFGGLDTVVFLSGLLPGKALSAYDDALMAEVMNVNFTGQAALLRRLLPHLNHGACVLMMSSVSGERGSFDPIYAAAKAAQIAFVKSLATWLAPAVRVNAIAPALIEGSAMFEAMAPERRQHHLKQTPTGRFTTKAELAGVMVDLCGPAWANMNGQVIRINGGAHV